MRNCLKLWNFPPNMNQITFNYSLCCTHQCDVFNCHSYSRGHLPTSVPFTPTSFIYTVCLNAFPFLYLQYSTHLHLADACMKKYKQSLEKLCEVEQVCGTGLFN